MTTATVARYIDRTEGGIRGLVKRGQIPMLKRDGVLYFDREEIDRWITECRRGKRRGRSDSRQAPPSVSRVSGKGQGE
jgi:hypothetical protein